LLVALSNSSKENIFVLSVLLSSNINCSNSRPLFFLKCVLRILFCIPFFHLWMSTVAPSPRIREPRPQPIPIAIPINNVAVVSYIVCKL
jgi:hypothetical protein